MPSDDTTLLDFPLFYTKNLLIFDVFVGMPLSRHDIMKPNAHL
jgi:hypothetical protein